MRMIANIHHLHAVKIKCCCIQMIALLDTKKEKKKKKKQLYSRKVIILCKNEGFSETAWWGTGVHWQHWFRWMCWFGGCEELWKYYSWKSTELFCLWGLCFSVEAEWMWMRVYPYRESSSFFINKNKNKKQISDYNKILYTSIFFRT